MVLMLVTVSWHFAGGSGPSISGSTETTTLLHANLHQMDVCGSLNVSYKCFI